MGGVMYKGSSVDGSDAREVQGVYVNPNNDNEWSTEPYNKEQREHEKDYRDWEVIYNHIGKHERTLSEELTLIYQNKSQLASYYRNLLIKQAELEGVIFR